MPRPKPKILENRNIPKRRVEPSQPQKIIRSPGEIIIKLYKRIKGNGKTILVGNQRLNTEDRRNKQKDTQKKAIKSKTPDRRKTNK
ncbi:MAG: hypothetical protein WC915_05825 [archaeon]|jgi:hypothetical protein